MRIQVLGAVEVQTGGIEVVVWCVFMERGMDCCPGRYEASQSWDS